MKPTQLASALRLLIRAQQPAFLWGPPGVGKSTVLRSVAASLDLDVCDIRAVLLDPVDLRGLPHINGDNRAHWCPPEFLPRDGRGILFLDELNAAPALVQAACYQLVLDRKLGEYTLPDGWSVIAAGNRETDRSVTHRMPSALANRFVHLSFDPDVDDWTAWALSANIPIETVAFIRFRPALLFAFDPAKHDKSFPTPRSWEFVSRLIAQDPDPSILFDLVAGAVGEGAAAEFCGFLKIFRSLPNVDSVLLAPDKATVPKDPATLYAVCGAIARKATDQNFARVIQYADRLPAEFSVLLVRDCIRANAALANTKAFVSWTSKHKDVLL